MAVLKTLRATFDKDLPRFHRTDEFLQHHVQFYGQTDCLRRSEEQNDYFDIEFHSTRGALDTIGFCKIEHVKLAWAPANITDKPPTGKAYVSHQAPRFDYDVDSKMPSLPIRGNNPFLSKWLVPAPPEPEQAICCPPTMVQKEAVDPCTPFGITHWPDFPIYPLTP